MDRLTDALVTELLTYVPILVGSAVLTVVSWLGAKRALMVQARKAVQETEDDLAQGRMSCADDMLEAASGKLGKTLVGRAAPGKVRRDAVTRAKKERDSERPKP
jgi:hypothetical protein